MKFVDKMGKTFDQDVVKRREGIVSQRLSNQVWCVLNVFSVSLTLINMSRYHKVKLH